MFLQRKLRLVETGILEKSNNLSQVTDKRKRTKRDICKTRCPEELSEPPVSIHQNIHYCLLVILHTIKFCLNFYIVSVVKKLSAIYAVWMNYSWVSEPAIPLFLFIQTISVFLRRTHAITIAINNGWTGCFTF